ncbi:MAG: DUF1778 domain-containing protein [Mycolicibacterium insubricum]|nr:DUF1778 domain-containing protein [Mycobacterium sp.]
MGPKTERRTVWLTADQDAVIRAAAHAEGVDLSTFTVGAALAHAHDVLADRRMFVVDGGAWDAFLERLDQPATKNPLLDQLFAEPSIFSHEA